MSARILVVYASPRGSTAEIARAIGKELRSAGYEVDVIEAGSVSSLEGCSAVVLGGPIYMGRLAGEIPKFIKKYRNALVRLPVAAFTVGISPVGKDPKGDVDSLKKTFHAAIAPLEPVAETMFAGKIDLSQLSFMQKWMVNKAKAPVGDFRDWEAIAVWARDLPGKLRV